MEELFSKGSSGKGGDLPPLFGEVTSSSSVEPLEFWFDDGKVKEMEKKGFEKGYRDGWKAGFEEGKREGLESGRKEIVEAVSRIKSILGELSRARDRVFEAVGEELVDLALASAGKIVKKEVSLDREVVLRNIKDAMSKLAPLEEVKIRVNPEDYGYIQELDPGFFERFSQGSAITFEADSSVERGGCVVETKFGLADARLETQWENLKGSLEDVGRKA